MSKNLKLKMPLRIGVLMGGPSSEHDISLASGLNVIEHLDRSKYQPVGIKISRDKEWFVRGRKTTEQKALENCDIIFNALHGMFGEDGKIQALLEYFDKPYTGSGIIASALAMDKLKSRELFRLSGLNVPKTLEIKKGENYQALLNVFANKIAGFPVIVKPRSNGSSFGVSVASDQSGLLKAVKAAFKIENKILVEEFLRGIEVTCGVLEDGQHANALPVTEIVPKKGRKFFDFNAKYKGMSEEITPAGIDEDTAKKVGELALRAHHLLGCKAYSRTDMIIKDKNIYILETNTLPGLTNSSLLPQAAKASGLTFPQLLDKIISSSLA